MIDTVSRALVFKEWSFLSKHFIGYATIGLLSVALNWVPGQTAAFASSILTITAFMVFYCHFAMKSVVAEKKDKNDLFMMTLPVSARQLYFIKFGFNASAFILMWLLYVSVITVIVVTSHQMPAVLLSLYLLVFSVMLPAFFIILTVGMVTESEGWTIIALVSSNVVSTITFNIVTNSTDITGAFGLGTFGEIGFVWPVWATPFFVVIAGITFAVLFVAVFKGLAKKDFF